jgi:hypothetical protein
MRRHLHIDDRTAIMNATIGKGQQSGFKAAKGAGLVVLGTALLLLVPLVAMQFTSEVAWSGSDFVAAAVMLLSAGLGYVAVAARLRARRQRLIAGGVALFALLTVWAELAVGIFH